MPQMPRQRIVGRARVQRGEALQHVWRAQHALRPDVIEAAKARERRLECRRVELRAERDLPADAFQGCFLSRPNAGADG